MQLCHLHMQCPVETTRIDKYQGYDNSNLWCGERLVQDKSTTHETGHRHWICRRTTLITLLWCFGLLYHEADAQILGASHGLALLTRVAISSRCMHMY